MPRERSASEYGRFGVYWSYIIPGSVRMSRHVGLQGRWLRPLFSLAGCAVWLVICTFNCGCVEYNRYEIELVPTSGGMERALTCWRLPDRKDGPAFPAAELERISALYPERQTPPDARRHRFRGVFAREMPADVGGAGTYAKFETPLGFAAVFVERFRGELDLDAALYDRRRNTDRAADLIVGWFEQQMSASPHWPQVQRFLHQEFRQDLRNFSTHLWLAEQQTQLAEQQLKELPFRAVLYLKERGYLALDDVLLLARPDRQQAGHRLAWVKNALARKCGLSDEAARTALAFLDDPARVERSWNDYLRTTPEYRRLLKRWQAASRDPNATPPEPLQVFNELLLDPAIALLLSHPDELHVSLATGVPPLHTNGQWDPQQQRVVWSLNLPRARSLPLLLYAAWAQPDEQEQVKHFGRVVLSGERLMEYAVWYASLTQAERSEWDAFLASLHPGQDLPVRMDTFRFSHEPERVPELDREGRPLSDRVRELLADALPTPGSGHP